jgi:hypothetical protein
MTARELGERLLNVKNPDAVVVLCVQDACYSALEFKVDESQEEDEDCVIGNVLLELDSESDVAQGLKNMIDRHELMEDFREMEKEVTDAMRAAFVRIFSL